MKFMISKWNINKVKDIHNSFRNCSSLTSLPDISNWDTSNVTYMSSVFFGCSSLISLPDLSKWNVNNVTDLTGIFKGCLSLTILPIISDWCLYTVDISEVFEIISSINSIIDLSDWDKNKLVNIELIFGDCLSLIFFPIYPIEK